MLLTEASVEVVLSPLEYTTEVDVTEQSEYEKLKGEIEKHSSIREEEADWKLVLELAFELLTKKTKDLRVCAYLIVSATYLHGVAGLIPGLKILYGLLNTYADELPPKRMRARQAAIEWLIEQLQRVEKSVKPVFCSKEQALELESLLNSITQLKEEGVILSGMKSLEIRSRAKRAIDKKDISQDKVYKNSSNTVNTLLDEDIKSEDRLRQIEKTCEQINLKLASHYNKYEPLSIKSFLKRRIALWGGVYQSPKNIELKTQLSPVQTIHQEQFKRVKADVSGVEKLEELFLRYPFWLDIQKKIFDICNESVGGLKDIARVVEEETLSFVNRLDGIERLRFSDLMPFANEDTKNWLKGRQKQNVNTITIRLRNIEKKWIKLEEKIRLMSVNGRFTNTLEFINTIYRRSRKKEENYQVLKLLASLYVTRGEWSSAMQCVELLEQLIKRHNLLEWNSELVLEVYRLKEKIIEKYYEFDQIRLDNELIEVKKNLIAISLTDAQ